MAYLSGIGVYLATALGFVSLFLGMFATSIYRELDDGAEKAMARFHLDVDRSRLEFRVWMAAGIFILIASVLFVGASAADLFSPGTLNTDLFRNIGRVGFIGGVSTSLVTLGSWWRRF